MPPYRDPGFLCGCSREPNARKRITVADTSVHWIFSNRDGMQGIEYTRHYPAQMIVSENSEILDTGIAAINTLSGVIAMQGENRNKRYNELPREDRMISNNITLDKLLSDIDQQIEVLTAIAQDNLILNEQLRLLNESRELLLTQELEISRLAELIDEDSIGEQLSIVDRQVEE